MLSVPIIVIKHRQRGAALLITLVLITLVSLLVSSNSQSVKLQQRLTSNSQAGQVAFQAAEMALREAASELESSVDLSQFCNTSKPYTYVINDISELRDDDNWAVVAIEGEPVSFNNEGYSGAAGENGYEMAITPNSPRYMIGCIDTDAIENYVHTQSIEVGQNIMEEDMHYFFRVFSVGFGPAGRIASKLEAHYVY
jgi:Tfp pilus assembly protein PilX